MENKNMTTLHVPNSISRSPLRRGFLVVLLALGLAWLGLLCTVQAQDGGYVRDNTAEGNGALNFIISLPDHSSGARNTAIGTNALSHDSNGFENTASGYFALNNNSHGN